RGVGLAAREPQPLHGEKLVRHTRTVFRRAIDRDGKQEEHVVRHVERTVGGKAPLPAEIDLLALLRGRGDHRHEIVAGANLAADFLVSSVAPTEGAFVIPDVEPGGFKRITKQSGGGAVFRGVADEYGRARRWHGG